MHSLGLLWLAWFVCLGCLGAGDRPRFVHLSLGEGLSQGTINAIVQDRTGFLWVGTQDGLNRYDGYLFRQFRHDPLAADSLGDSFINALLPDEGSGLWVAHGEGLDHFNAETETFQHIPLPVPKGSVPAVSSLAADAQGTLWIATWGMGLFRFSPQSGEVVRFSTVADGGRDRIANLHVDPSGCIWLTAVGDGLIRFDPIQEKFTFFRHDPQRADGLPSDQHVILRQDSAGQYWVGGEGGVGIFDPDTGSYKGYPIRDAQGRDLPTVTVVDLLFTQAGRLWLTAHEGLFCLDLEKGVAEPIQVHQESGASIRNSFKSMYLDRAGIAWVGSVYDGLFRHDPAERAFRHLEHNPSLENSLAHPCVFAIAEGKDGVVWFGSPGGLTRYQKRTGQFTQIQQTDTGEPVGNIMALCFDQRDQLWVGSNMAGLFLVEAQGRVRTLAQTKFGRGQVWSLTADPDGSIWVGGHKILSQFRDEKEVGSWSSDPSSARSISHPDIRALYRGQDGYLWVGTYGGGLNRTPAQSPGQFERFTADASKPGQLSDNQVTAITSDSAGQLWVGTPAGLNCFDGTAFRVYTRKDGLPNDYVSSILFDSRQRLWVSTYGGLVCFDPKTRAARRFDPMDGLLNYEFNAGSALLSRDGEMYFGGISGVDAFYPNGITQNLVPPSVVITDLLLLNESTPLQREKPESPLAGPISQTEEIRLSYKDYAFTLEFAALHFANPARNHYAYKLEGVDKAWISTDASRRFATYTKLGSGTYTFRVKASNKDGVWNDKGAALRIHIEPPIWQTWWAIVFYVVLGLLAIYLGMLLRVRGLKRRNQALKAEVSARTSELEGQKDVIEAQKAELEKQVALVLVQKLDIEKKAAELRTLSEVKSRFFADLSHEFRTPLTLSIGPLEDMLAGFCGPLNEQIRLRMEMMLRNNRRLLDLVNQLLDVTKLEAGGMTLVLRDGDLVAFVGEHLRCFEPVAERMGLTLECLGASGGLITGFDPQKMKDILDNLLSNALKFTKRGGRITVKVWKQSGKAFLSVKDTGEGIPAAKIPVLFDRYYQGAENTSFSASSGLGLALVKELVSLHQGHIEVESSLGLGTEFVVSFPLVKSDIPLDGPNEAASQEPSAEVDEPNDDAAAGSVREVVLVVDDHADIRSYLRSILSGRYEVLEASNGEQGLEMARRFVPDLVISDVMMPKPDGFELCQILKADLKTSHIPVVLLTARSAQADKLEGLSGGADDYLIKPFNAKEVQVRVENLIEGRRRLREIYSRAMRPQVLGMTLDEEKVPSMDEAFLEKAVALVRSNMARPDFGVAELADEMALSRRQLLRKLSALTGLPPSDFVRNIRLHQAASLLKQRSGNVSEIAQAVGFETTAHFSKLFKKYYGVVPSEYSGEEFMPSA